MTTITTTIQSSRENARETILDMVFENFMNYNRTLLPENLTCVHPHCGGTIHLENRPVIFEDGTESKVSKRRLLVCDRCGITSPSYHWNIEEICIFWDTVLRNDAEIYRAIANNKLFCSTCMQDNFVDVDFDGSKYRVTCENCYSEHGYSYTNTGIGHSLKEAIKNFIDNNTIIGKRD